MSRFGSLLAPIRKGLLDRDDDRVPFDPFPTLGDAGRAPAPPPPKPPRRPLRLRAPVGPLARNRVDDVRGVETAIDRTGLLDRTPGGGVFDSFLDIGIRNFQRKNDLKQDGLLKPKGPTEQMLNRVAGKRTGKEEPDKDKDKKDCARLKGELANAEQAAKEAQERARKWDAEFNKWNKEVERLSEQLKNKLIQLGLETAIPLIRNLRSFRKLLSTRLDNASTLTEVLDLREKLNEAKRKIDEAIRARDVEEAEAAAHQAEAEKLRKQIAAAGCG